MIYFNRDMTQRLAVMFHDSLEKNGVLPKDPKRNKKFRSWVENMGCHVGHVSTRENYSFTTEGHVGFWISCPPISKALPGRIFRTSKAYKVTKAYKVRIEVPYELADRILTLGFMP